MTAIVEAFWVMAFVLLWIVVLPVAGVVEVGLVVSDKIDHTVHRTSSSA
jgi:hypothetical protein